MHAQLSTATRHSCFVFFSPNKHLATFIHNGNFFFNFARHIRSHIGSGGVWVSLCLFYIEYVCRSFGAKIMTKNQQSEHRIDSLWIIYCLDGCHFEFLALATKWHSLSWNKNNFEIQQVKILKKSLLVKIILQKPTQKREKDRS